MRSILVWLAACFPFAALAQTVTIHVDTSSNRHSISPFIYGVAYGPQGALSDLNATINRYGGNPASRYNWSINASNRADDYYYESIGENSATPGELGDSFISASKAGGAEATLTIPMLDWIAKLGPGRSTLASFSQAKYGAQTASDPSFPDAGNGILASAGNPFVTGNDPNDANVPNNVSFQQNWVNHLLGANGTSAAGGLKYYTLDNEPSIWFASHRDVHPIGPTMQEVRDKTVAYATMIKSLDAGALTLAPEEWGYEGMLYSGYDQQYNAAHNYAGVFPDRDAHGGADYYPYLLNELRLASQAAGHRLLDVVTTHYYPQSGEFDGGVTPALQGLRNRSTRSLWDPNYVDESYINDKVMLIPRMKQWVADYYPGTRIGITEYNWGAEDHINGATAQADVMGIIGREGGVDFAIRWLSPPVGSPVYNAFKMYRNYDGSKSTFGDMSVGLTSSANADVLSAFAAVRGSDNAVTLMVVNKDTAAATLAIDVANFTAGASAQVWQLTSTNTIQQKTAVAIASNALSTSVPAQSITLFVIPAGTVTPPSLHGDANGDNRVNTSDIFYLINFIFSGGPAPRGYADSNGDGRVNSSDIFYLINYIFSGGPAPK